jgi:purine nucleoside phosphorylase
VPAHGNFEHLPPARAEVFACRVVTCRVLFSASGKGKFPKSMKQKDKLCPHQTGTAFAEEGRLWA